LRDARHAPLGKGSREDGSLDIDGAAVEASLGSCCGPGAAEDGVALLDLENPILLHHTWWRM
jgi:hypothetical protein